jgi:hypothetical protein
LLEGKVVRLVKTVMEAMVVLEVLEAAAILGQQLHMSIIPIIMVIGKQDLILITTVTLEAMMDPQVQMDTVVPLSFLEDEMVRMGSMNLSLNMLKDQSNILINTI